MNYNLIKKFKFFILLTNYSKVIFPLNKTKKMSVKILVLNTINCPMMYEMFKNYSIKQVGLFYKMT